MRVSLIMKFAVRTLGRSKRRTLLSAIGIGVGCAVALFITAFMRSGSEMRIRAIADSGFGHLRIAPSGWMKSRENKLRLSDWHAELQAMRSVDGIRVAAPHARTTALLAFGTRVTGVEMLGVDPPAEKKLSCLIRAVQEGRYLRPGDRDVTVIGNAIAERLEVELEDDLFLTVVREDGNMEYAMLRIVGIVNTGSRDIDASICHVMLDDLERLTGLDGAGEITITLEDPSKIDQMAAQLSDQTGGRNEVLTWREIQPAQGADSASDKAFMNLFIGIVGVVVILGIASAQLTTILERKREFAVLMALGMKGFQVVRLVLLEAVALGLLGAAAGLALVTPLLYYTDTKGIDFGSAMGGDMAVSGVLFDFVMYTQMGLWMIPYALSVALISTLIAALYPAWFAMKTDPTSALSLREA